MTSINGIVAGLRKRRCQAALPTLARIPTREKLTSVKPTVSKGAFLTGEAGECRMVSKIISAVLLCLAVVLGAAPAAGQNDGELRQCVNSLRGSRWESSGDEEVSAFDNLVWHCQEEIYRRHANQPSQQPRPRTAKRHR
jgi:hypothetical protein